MAALAVPSAYSVVKVLLLCWEDSSQPEFETQLKGLAKELKEYKYDLETYKIKSVKPHQNLALKLHSLLESDREGTLLIIYYGGHGLNDGDQNNVWIRDDPQDVDITQNPKVNWSALQSLFLDECRSHVLFLLDCCFAASAVQYTHGASTVEAIVAVGFDRVAPLQGKDSFTKFLTDVLKSCRSNKEGVYASRLCALVASGLNQTRARVADGPGRRVTPHHLVYSNKPSTIFLCPLTTTAGPHSVTASAEESESNVRATTEEGIDHGHESSLPITGTDYSIAPAAVQHTVTPILSQPRVARGVYEDNRSNLRAASVALSTERSSFRERLSDGQANLVGSGSSLGVKTPDSRPNSPSHSEGSQSGSYDMGRPRSAASDPGLGGHRSHMSVGIRSTIYPSGSPFMRLSSNEIRIAHIHPSRNQTNPISYYFTVHNLIAEHKSYQAISHVWGKAGNSEAQCIHNSHRYSVGIRTSLERALQRIRDEEDEVSVWVDMLCIDRENDQDNDEQLGLMPLIFKQADEVMVWLGTGDTDSETAMTFIPQLVNLKAFDDLVKSDTTPNQWQAMVHLMENEYFSRRWVFLEVILAQRAVIYCGTHTVPWDDFCDAVLLLGSRFEDIQYLCMHYAIKNGLGFDLHNLADLRAMSAYSVVEASRNLFREPAARTLAYTDESLKHRTSSRPTPADRTLQTLVSLLPGLQASAPHDVIYALLPVSSDRMETGIGIDRGEPFLEMYQRFVQYCAVTSMSIDIICRPWAPRIGSTITRRRQRTDSWPSWICTTEKYPFGKPTKGVYCRRNGNVFLGRPGRRTYDAAHGTVAVPIFRRSSDAGGTRYDGTMIVSGFQVGQIDDLKNRASSGTLHHEWIDMSGWEEGSPNIPDHFWRTLVADRGPDDTATPAWYHRACLYWLELQGGEADVNYNPLHRNHHPSSAVQYMQRVQSVIWNRKLFAMEDLLGRTLYGLAPEESERDDSIVILYGCSVPVVLRRRGDAWQLLGECFVYGIMEGEAMRLEQYLKATEEFLIC